MWGNVTDYRFLFMLNLLEINWVSFLWLLIHYEVHRFYTSRIVSTWKFLMNTKVLSPWTTGAPNYFKYRESIFVGRRLTMTPIYKFTQG